MKKEVNICDKCKDRIAKQKCCLCDSDVCKECSEMELIGIFEDIVCTSCSKKLDDCGMEGEEFWKGFIKNNKGVKEKIMEYIKRNIMLQNLKGAKKDDDDNDSAKRKLMEAYFKKTIGKNGKTTRRKNRNFKW